jgi:hypothetical protein
MPGVLTFQAIFFLCVTAVFLASLQTFRRFLELKHERQVPIANEELRERLERIELAVEATAVEVERISEANRFMAKLLTDREGAGNLLSRPERVITPH